MREKIPQGQDALKARGREKEWSERSERKEEMGPGEGAPDPESAKVLRDGGEQRRISFGRKDGGDLGRRDDLESNGGKRLQENQTRGTLRKPPSPTNFFQRGPDAKGHRDERPKIRFVQLE